MFQHRSFICPQIEAFEQQRPLISFSPAFFSAFDDSHIQPVEDLYKYLEKNKLLPSDTPPFSQFKLELPNCRYYLCHAYILTSKKLDDFAQDELKELTSLVVRLAHLTKERVILEDTMVKREITYTAAQERAFASLAGDKENRWTLDTHLHVLYRDISLEQFPARRKTLQEQLYQLPVENDFHKVLHEPDAASLAYASAQVHNLKTLCTAIEQSAQAPLHETIDSILGLSLTTNCFYGNYYLFPDSFIKELHDVLSYSSKIINALSDAEFRKDVFERMIRSIKRDISRDQNQHQRMFLENDDAWREEFSGKVVAFHDGKLAASAGEKKSYVYSTLMAVPIPNLDKEIEMVNRSLQQQGVNPKDCFFSYAHPVKMNFDAFCYADLRISGYYDRLNMRLSIN